MDKSSDSSKRPGPARDSGKPQPAEGKSTVNDVSSTLGAFSTWMKQKKKEQEAALTEAERLRRARHELILQVMIDIRRALVDVSQLELGERFSFILSADDWHGWPRMTLRLKDRSLETADYPYFQVLAHDRQGRGVVEIIFGNPLQPERISLTQQEEVRRLPRTLKRCVRFYLDLIGQIVLEAEGSEAGGGKDGAISESPLDAAEAPSLTGDLYEDYSHPEDYLERLPDLEEVSELPTPIFDEKDKPR